MSAPRTDQALIAASPGQLYITASGHLYHAGKICIVMVGLPARGKTSRTVSIDRYLRWLGVRAKKFHLSDYRREKLGPEANLPENYFSFTAQIREELRQTAMNDIWEFFAAGGQVALYDAMNPLASERRKLAKMCEHRGVECLFIECSITDERILARNITEINRVSPEYAPMEKNKAIEVHLKKLKQTFSFYEPLSEEELIYIKIQNDGERFMINHGTLGYMLNRVLLFNLNSRKRRGSIFFAKAGRSNGGTEDDDLSEEGQEYSQKLFATTVKYMHSADYPHHDHSGLDPSQLHPYTDVHSRAQSRAQSPVHNKSTNIPSNPNSDYNLVLLTSSRAKTVQTSLPFKAAGFPTTHYSLMTQRKAIGEAGPDYYERYEKDPYHTAFPRGESFQDVAIRLEPVILELERIETSVLIIAHQSVLAVLFGYFKGLSTQDIPKLEFDCNKLYELSSTGYEHEVKTIQVPGVSADGHIIN